jgi:hypothetical protein
MFAPYRIITVEYLRFLPIAGSSSLALIDQSLQATLAGLVVYKSAPRKPGEREGRPLKELKR